MKKFLLAFVVILLVAVVAVLGYASTRPDDFRYQRSIIIAAQPEAIFQILITPKLGELWSPWEKLDPDMKREYSGPEKGIGAKYSWDGDKNIGAGNITITQTVHGHIVVSRLEFTRPFHAVNTTQFLLSPARLGRTQVTWAMYGKNTLTSKVMGLFMDCEKMVNEQFETGLANLKALVESKKPVPTASPTQPVTSSK